MATLVRLDDDDEQPLSRTWDIIYASPLIVLYIIVVAGMLKKIGLGLDQFHQKIDGVLVLTLVQHLLTLVFAVLQIGLFLLRNLPSRRSHGSWPRAAAILGSNSGFALLVLPHSTQTLSTAVWSATIITLGIAASIYALAWLGRCFAILPQVRGLVMDGPYRYVRHPLYLAELVTAFGVALQFQKPWSLLLYGCVVAVQICRMHYEEETLASAFPEYRDYSAHVSRLIPGIY